MPNSDESSAHTMEVETLRRLFVEALESRTESILASFHPDGRFGTDPWIVRDQDVILPLALLYRYGGSRCRGNPGLLEKIARGGCYLRERQDEQGMYPFTKKDGSEWGRIYMPWTYLRWIVVYDLLAGSLEDTDRQTWEEGLRLGYSGIAGTELTSASNIYPGPLPGQPPPAEGEVIPWIHNIPSHHAAGLYLAGKHFDRPEWQTQAREYLHRVVDAQTEYGWWTEHHGPVVLYNRVYLEALAIYYHYSRDPVVGRALERGNHYHLNCTYPDGADIETIDERNPYKPVEARRSPDGTITTFPHPGHPHPGLYASPEGHALLALLLHAHRRRGSRDITNAEFLLLCLPGEKFAADPLPAPEARFTMGDRALIARVDPWLLSFSAYCTTRTPNRFIQDRQNMFSIFHRESGLILGGGNTKIQPLWSTMTVGNTRLVSPEGSTPDTDLAPESALDYVPDQASIVETGRNAWNLRLETAGAVLVITAEVQSSGSLSLRLHLEKEAPDGRPVTAHLTFIRCPESTVTLSDGSQLALGEESWSYTGLTGIRHHNWELTLPAEAEVLWPALPHNPYTADGHAEISEGRLAAALPFGPEHPSHELTLKVPPPP